MSHVKLQSLIRKFKNSSVEENVIKNYSYNLSIDADIDTTFLFQTSKSDSFLYKIDVLERPVSGASIPIKIVNKSKELPLESNVKHYVNSDIKGYLHNLFNAELCNEEWIISMYFLSIVNHMFIRNEKIKINSLHMNNLTHSTISAFHHVLHNSSIKSNIEWQWLNVIPNDFNLTNKLKNILERVCRKYKHRLLHLIDSRNYSTNNINYIINETNAKISKINMLCALCDVKSHSKSYIANIILSIKLMDQIGVMYVKIPNVDKWDTRFINILLLHSLIFLEVYVYEFNITTESTYLLCKNRRKINNESIFKKLYYIVSNPNFVDHNLFDEKIFDEPDIKEWLTRLLDNTEIPFSTDVIKNNLDNTIVDYISSNLHVNTETFL
jgi:hypothetical protein